MPKTPENNLRVLPPVNDLLEHPSVQPLVAEQGRKVVMAWIRDELAHIRNQLLSADNNGDTLDRDSITAALVDGISRCARRSERAQIGRVINATGVILHTGLGRAPLSKAAQAAVVSLAGAGNVEIDLESGERRYRGHQLQPAWQTLTGAEDSLIVNNNAAATLLALQTLCAGREVIISRGQLIEIGGSFRLPEIFLLSGSILREVGTTNRTKLSDYKQAIGPETAAIMHVHPSNYRVIGFTSAPEIDELVPLAQDHGLIAIDDIGSGSLVDVTDWGLPREPTFPESIACGADVVLGSGDKLLGGPQCGIILGKAKCVESIRQHPLARAVRVGKLTLAALSATLDSYVRDQAVEEIPTIAMLTTSVEQLRRRANVIQEEVGALEDVCIDVIDDRSPIGGGSLPGAELPTVVVSVHHSQLTVAELSLRLRLGTIRVFARIQHDRVLLDLRSVQPEDDSKLALAIRLIASHEYV